MTQDLHHGREAFQRGAWREATVRLAAAEAVSPLAIEDLERLAVASYLVGEDEKSIELWTRAHQLRLDERQVPGAVRAAFWMMLVMLARGEWARASGWLARCRRLIETERDDCPESGLLLVLDARSSLKQGDIQAAHAATTQAVELSERFVDQDLRALSLLTKGQALGRQGRTSEAVTHFDEAMVAITIGGMSPIATGTVYCAVIDACRQIMDLRRMREWTGVLTGWCRGQPDLVPFRGQCLVHRAEILCMSGAWSEALDAARQACDQQTNSPTSDEATESSPVPAPSGLRAWTMVTAFDQIAEIERVRGHFAEAEAAYRAANAYGRAPGAGLALLRLAQDDTAGAAAAIRRALGEPADRRVRSTTLVAAVDIEIAAGDTAAARAAADELASLAVEHPSPWLSALAAQAHGALLLAEGDARAAIARLREAWMAWQELEAPYEAARIRVAMGLAHCALGDEEAAALEFDAAERVCERLGAAPELRRIAHLRRAAQRPSIAGLTPREHEILLRVATGMTNRAIAQELFISERTVDRHVSNILTKLDLKSRSAATAYAYEHHLVR